jgi:hypothetical protein
VISHPDIVPATLPENVAGPFVAGMKIIFVNDGGEGLYRAIR